jgi:hypothetical protein
MPRPEIERAAEEDDPVDEAELAAAAFLARYQGRTLDAYRYDLRAFFEWAADDRLDILQATRPQIELYVRAMKVRCLAAATIDRRLSTTAAPKARDGDPDRRPGGGPRNTRLQRVSPQRWAAVPSCVGPPSQRLRPSPQTSRPGLRFEQKMGGGAHRGRARLRAC